MLRATARRERMVGLFAAAVVLFDPPILNLVSGRILGWPAPYLYLFGLWMLLILAVAAISERGRSADGGERDHGRE